MKWWTASNISVFSSTVRICEPFHNISKFETSFYSIGSRTLNIWHCQLRNEASSLNHHLFQSHLYDSSQCACGDAIENNFLYFYVCPLFIRHRIQLLNSKKVSNWLGAAWGRGEESGVSNHVVRFKINNPDHRHRYCSYTPVIIFIQD
jgi:exoribonuclease II